jgi:hypothetical protein
VGFWTVQCHLFFFISQTPGVSASVDEIFSSVFFPFVCR